MGFTNGCVELETGELIWGLKEFALPSTVVGVLTGVKPGLSICRN